MTDHEIDVRADVTLSVETFGDSGDPPIVLVPAAPAAFDASDAAGAWSDAVCDRLAAGLRFVVRYAGRNGDDERAGDLLALLDALELGRAHLVAAAGDLRVAQLVVDRHPDRVASLTVVVPAHQDHAPDDPAIQFGPPTYVLAGTDDAVVTAILRHTSGGWQRQADRLANRAVAGHNPTAWFDQLYAAATAGEVDMPWDRDEPNPVLVGWARGRPRDDGQRAPVDGQRAPDDGRRTLVVGSGLGRDAEYVADLGFPTTAFDISPAAIDNVRRRYPRSLVEYHVANLLSPPPAWDRAFEVVIEIYTLQAMPRSVRSQATANIAGFVAPGGTLVVIQAIADDADVDAPGPPWPPTRTEIEAFASAGLTPVRIEAVDSPAGRRWLAEFVRPH
jgi:pimeloyl-ACP methyl ester carboxylesterase